MGLLVPDLSKNSSLRRIFRNKSQSRLKRRSRLEAYGARLESAFGESHRGFESHLLRFVREKAENYSLK